MIKRFIPLIIFLAGSVLIPNYAVAQESGDNLKYRKWRITIFPPLSTNGIEAPNYTAKYSINILAGYHGGLDGGEIGGLVNYTKYYAHGFQLAGLGNITGGDMAGVNIAGLGNISREEMAGIQVAGLANISGDDLEGIQVAGAFNIAGDQSSGLQFSGIGNVAKGDLEGLQGAGILNAAWGNISGLQAAGIANIAKEDVEGLQAAGFLNFAGANISGLQASGAANIAFGDIEGLMVSGGLNVAQKNASGLLISGGLNIAKNLEGASIGFISYYGNGRKNIDIRFSDGGFTDIGFTLGTHRVYNSALFGYNTLLDRDVYRIGLAVGLEKNIQDAFKNWQNETMYVNQEFAVTHQFENKWSNDLNLIYSYKFLLGKRFGKGFSIYGGPAFNAQVTRVNEAHDYSWYSLWSPERKGRKYQFWVGFTAGIRLFKQKAPARFRDEFNNWEMDW